MMIVMVVMFVAMVVMICCNGCNVRWWMMSDDVCGGDEGDGDGEEDGWWGHLQR